jgi:serine/threonine protein kinase
MGEVYRARDTRLQREVAIKILSDARPRDDHPVQRFEREARLLASLNHPNIATLHGLESSGDVQALVMEHVEGEGLDTMLARKRLSVDKGLHIARQIADAIDTLMIKEDPGLVGAGTPSLIVVLNWFEELKRAAPPGSRGQNPAR